MLSKASAAIRSGRRIRRRSFGWSSGRQRFHSDEQPACKTPALLATLSRSAVLIVSLQCSITRTRLYHTDTHKNTHWSLKYNTKRAFSSILSSWWINLSPTINYCTTVFRGSAVVGLVQRAVKASSHLSYVPKFVYPAWAVVSAAIRCLLSCPHYALITCSDILVLCFLDVAQQCATDRLSTWLGLILLGDGVWADSADVPPEMKQNKPRPHYGTRNLYLFLWVK